MKEHFGTQHVLHKCEQVIVIFIGFPMGPLKQRYWRILIIKEPDRSTPCFINENRRYREKSLSPEPPNDPRAETKTEQLSPSLHHTHGTSRLHQSGTEFGSI